VFELWEIQRAVFLLQHVVIIRLHTIFSWWHTGYICTLHTSQTSTSNCSVDSSQDNPECQVPHNLQCNRLAQHRRRGIFPSATK
jgi:hypothetical protein